MLYGEREASRPVSHLAIVWEHAISLSKLRSESARRSATPLTAVVKRQLDTQSLT